MAGMYSIRVVMMTSGERLPMLFNRESGLPLFAPTVYMLTEYRQKNRASNTIERVLREIEVLLIFLDAREICLDERLQKGQLLTLAEIDGLVRQCSLPTSEFKSLNEKLDEDVTRRALNVTKMERFRMRSSSKPPKGVSSVTAANRVRTIQAYLLWQISQYLSHHDLSMAVRAEMASTKKFTEDALTERVPSTKGRNIIGMREGASPDVLDRLLEVINALSPENPWLSSHARIRNSLAICWLFKLGLRRGELLTVKISDINFQKEVVIIARRPDDPNDPRKKQPKAKTRDRKIPLSPELAAATHHYITKIRPTLSGARLHEFLFVSDRTGVPLELDTLNKVFRVLRKAIPELPDDLTPHVLRHSWNDKFSEAVDKKGLSPDEEKKLRSFLMGWSDTSDSAMAYSRRHVRLKAQKVSLDMQAEMVREKKNES